MEPVYYGHLGTNKKFSDYQGVLIIKVTLYDKASFGTTTNTTKNIYLIICDTEVHIPIVQISIICAPPCICSGANMDNSFMHYMCHI